MCFKGDDIPGKLWPHILASFSETFVGRSLCASFTEAAGNNIVPAFRCVRSHISGCSIRNRPQRGTINPWPQQQICAVTAQHGAINQTQRVMCTLPPFLFGCDCHPADQAYMVVDLLLRYHTISGGSGDVIIHWP